MLYEQDYGMRMIREMIRFLLKVFFHCDSESVSDVLLRETVDRGELNSLLHLADEGRISEAEDRLFEMPDDGKRGNLAAALAFYSHLNDKSDEFLEEHDFSREEIVSGIRDAAARNGAGGLSEMFPDG